MKAPALGRLQGYGMSPHVHLHVPPTADDWVDVQVAGDAGLHFGSCTKLVHFDKTGRAVGFGVGGMVG